MTSNYSLILFFHSRGKRQKIMIRKLSRNWPYYIKAQRLQQVVRMHQFNIETGEGVVSVAQKLTTVSLLSCSRLHHAHSTSGLP